MTRILKIFLILVFCAGCAAGAKGRAGVDVQKAARENGILVNEVKAGGAAEKAGLQKGDVIVTYEGKKIIDPADIEKDIEVSPVGRTIQMTVFRQGKLVNVQLPIEKKRSRVVNIAHSTERPDYSIAAIEDIIWIGSYPYTINLAEVQEGLKLLPRAIQELDHKPQTPVTFFTVIVR